MKTERYPNELTSITYNMVVLKPDVIDLTKKYPLLICLVGIAARGDNITALENDIPPNVRLAPDSDGFIVVAVQTPDTYDDEVTFALNWAFKNLPVSPDTGVYGYGFSYGGSLWGYVAATPEQAKVFDAIAPVATVWTTIPVDGWKNVANANLQIWAFHNLGDDNAGTPPEATKNYVDAVNVVKPGLATKTLFNVNGHGGWNEAANTVSPPAAPGGQGLTNPATTLWKWFKMNTRTKRVPPPATITPTPTTGVTAKAAATLKGNEVYLDGSASTGYDAVAWTDVSPGTKGTWVGGTGYYTAVSKLAVSGTYVFELKVTKKATATTPAVSATDVVTVYFTVTPTVDKVPVLYEEVSHVVTFKDGSKETCISVTTDVVTKYKTLKTASGSYTILP